MGGEARCAVCGRTILAGERVHAYRAGDGGHEVCELCVSRAERLGWRREGEEGPTGAAHERRGRFGRLLRGRHRPGGRERAAGGPTPPPLGSELEEDAWEEGEVAYELEPGTEAEAADLEPDRVEPEVEAGPGAEAEADVEPGVEVAPDAEPGADVGEADVESGAEVEPAEDEEPAPAPPPARPDPAGRGMRSGGAPADPGGPGPHEIAVARFNASEAGRTVAGLARTLGRPWVSVGAAAGAPGEVRITVAWELSWYQWGVDVGDELRPVFQIDKGHEIDQIDYAARQWNAMADDAGWVSLGSDEERAGA